MLVTGGLTSSARLDAAEKRPMKIEDLYKFKRVAAPQISPDGKSVVYQISTIDFDANKSSTALWIAATDGKTPPMQLTDPKGKKDTAPHWSPDGKKILFESTRSGSGQLWVLAVEGGEPKQVTEISTGATAGTWSPDGTHIAFVSSVFPEFSEKPFAESDKLNKAKDEEIEKSPVKAKVFTKLFYRHWDEYVGDKRQHIFVCKVDGTEPRDVTPGDRDANPTSSTFSSGDDFTFTPDSKHLVFTAVPEKDESWSTNYELCRVSVTNTSPKWETLTLANKSADSGPKFSPDGKKLAWRAQKKAGYEADKWDIVVADCKADGTLANEVLNVTNQSVTSVNEFAWGDKGWFLYTADYNGSTPVFSVMWSGVHFFKPTILDGAASSPTFAAGRVAYQRSTLTSPAEVFTGELDNSLRIQAATNLSHTNDSLLDALDLPRPEAVEVPVEGGVKMQMWILKPPGFDPKKKWPVAFLVHGGPQSAWEDGWSFRWNPSLWAAQGYVVVMPNPRGSTGFGQKFVDEITADWGGKCYRDLVAGLDYVEKLPYVDKDRIGSAGASFGGYMMNWFAVNDIAKRFKCLITHCSVWNFESMWGTTDELWFDEFEHGGLPWEIPGKYREFSPHAKAAKLKENKTPMLVIHNDYDFRCPIGQGHELFTTLQRQGVPSRFVNFPDEGHWVLKPKNGAYWHKEVFSWLAKYAPPGGK
ncbi:MAG: S9 family peptidase [Planctomycetaceae bacterium]|nr:S9 family peptidase [Planctomycetaceae bacterium]